MPEISRFFGIIIRMFASEHEPPHFHAIYGARQAEIGISPIRVIKGDLPVRAQALAIEWARLHEQELMTNWFRLRARQTPARIEPLD